jgi:hypothetical protein
MPNCNRKAFCKCRNQLIKWGRNITTLSEQFQKTKKKTQKIVETEEKWIHDAYR